ncbi:hypothetical protein ASPZODRAFT_13081 [Penicilliopsis zonata CBS 506.65]|uniref:Ecp2 effector protein domain-containing protein n=1 Tax=Penicilliopsis zonata CBS 506.65 TaxID=1073090 RepID=A0A1L9SSA3_9EURO|nr:hypothetical protein ASPZODRAFT_13081 [Penicilliopsis zonata CBS 506.65]OJJ49977.1 hypothetical protein ASPZODRAFT_13081 [Penicilliopsis zonata CBS 506.65]
MHFSKVLAIVAAIAPASVYGYAVANVDLNYWDACAAGEVPQDEPKHTSTVSVAQGSCQKMDVEQRWTVHGYSVDGWLITDDAKHECFGVTLYTSPDCTGKPQYVLPFEQGSDRANGVCMHMADLFSRDVSFQLECKSAKDMSGTVHQGTSPLAALNKGGDQGAGLPGLGALGL